MRFFSRISGLGTTKSSVQTNVRAAQMRSDIKAHPENGGVRYDPQLVHLLKQEHRTLFSIYADLVQAKECDDFETVRGLLDNFKFTLQTHLMVENVHFYVYLLQRYAADRDTSAFISQVRRDMDGIAHMTAKFVDTYASADDYTPQMKIDFGTSLAAIGNVLSRRVALEESRLYILYGSG